MRRDLFFVCASCNNEFLWTPAEQQRDSQAPACCPGCRYLLPADDRRRGVVKFYSVRRHWGFIIQPDGAELFFHRSALAPDEALPREGELVEYAVELSSRGPCAIAMRRLGAPIG